MPPVMQNPTNLILFMNSCSDRAGTGTDAGVRIISIQVESVAESGFIQSGPTAAQQRNIKVTVRAWCNNTNQWIDVWYTQMQMSNPPTFTYIGSMRCGCGGGRDRCNGGACPDFLILLYLEDFALGQGTG
jgi:hypothetical protein